MTAVEAVTPREESGLSLIKVYRNGGTSSIKTKH